MSVFSIMGFLIKYWKYFALLLSGTLIGSYITAKISTIKHTSLMNKYKTCQVELSNCQSANTENQKTIQSLQAEISAKNKSCNERINYYKKLIKDMQKIDNLTGGQSEKPVSNNCPDDMCVELYRMFK